MTSKETMLNDRRSFTEWVTNNSDIGLDGNGHEQSYISRQRLEQHLDRRLMLSLLSEEDKHLDIRRIASTFLQTFAILVWISDSEHQWTDYIRFFVQSGCKDADLPLSSPPQPGDHSSHRQHPPFPDDREGLEAWRQFSEQQWRFLPLQFCDSDDNRIEKAHSANAVDVRHIRPITVLEELYLESFGYAKIWKVLPHKSSGLPEVPIVLKEYPMSEFDNQFHQEHTAYVAIGNYDYENHEGDDTDPDRLLAHFLGYYGAFAQGDKCSLLLEFANEGTLLDLFVKCYYLPRDLGEALALWHGALHLLEGLDFLHNMHGSSRVIHQDIKPANIFVFRDPHYPDRLLFKFGDFGMSSTTQPSRRGEATGPDNQGARMYCAPELSSWTEGDQDVPRKVTAKGDIWSLGGVFYELALWAVLHERGRKDFRQARVDEAAKIVRVVNAGYRGAFHDGRDVLKTVKAQVQDIKKRGIPAVAHLSEKVMDFVLAEMLQPQEHKRIPARELKARLVDILDEAPNFGLTLPTQTLSPTLMVTQGGSSTPPPLVNSPDTVTPDNSFRHELHANPAHISAPDVSNQAYTHSQATLTLPMKELTGNPQQSLNGAGARSYSPHSPRNSFNSFNSFTDSPAVATSSLIGGLGTAGFSRPSPKHRASNYPHCTVEQVKNWHETSKKHRGALPGMDSAVKELKDRDQCFILDNSSTMMVHWDEVRKTARALVSITQEIDPDGVELVCTRSNDRKKFKDFRLIDPFLNDNRPQVDSGPCKLEMSLNQVLPRLVDKAATPKNIFMKKVGRAKTIKGVNVYVLTDGVWEDSAGDSKDDICGNVGQAIEETVTRVKNLGLGRTFLSIQFIRFGDSEVGAQRLQWLDDKLGRSAPGAWDIVDTTYHTRSVWKMIIGATSPYEENIEDDAPEPSSHPLPVRRSTALKGTTHNQSYHQP